MTGRRPESPADTARAREAGSPTQSTAGHMAFIGVSTGASSIMQIFPRWAEILRLPTSTLVSSDIPLDAPPERYRQERSEEHTSELQSRGHLVCRLLLEKKKACSVSHK